MKKILVRIFFSLLVLSATTASAQESISALLPMPHTVELLKGKEFDLKKAGKIDCQMSDSLFILNEFKSIIKNRTDVTLPAKGGNKIIIKENNTLSPEAYKIEVNKKSLVIEGSRKGIYYALKTIDQILIGDTRNSAEGKIAPIRIEDEPRYEHRAVMLDPARHFIPVEDVKFFIDQMAKYKYNILQLHLTDDQGWRIEIKSHPQLTKIGANRNPRGGNNGPDNGYYTQEQLKELVEYAAARNIEIIPELDIPGHSVAILAAYPHLGCSFRQGDKIELGKTVNMMLCANSDEAYSVYDDIIKEVAEIFPSRYIHLGGDEAAIKENWAKCEECKALMEKNGYTQPSQLMNIFFGRMLESVSKNGKEAILWCELDNIWPPANDYLFPYPKNVTLVTWRNALTPKCIELTHKYGHKLIMAPGEHTYLDYPQWRNDLPEYNNWGMPTTTLETSYKLDPSYNLPNEESNHIMGVMATMWAEAIKDINRVNYMFFPRGLAIAEAGWSRMEQRSWDSFKKRLMPNLDDLMRSGVSFRVPFEISPRK
ncbi:MAG: beta-N-acetylhexosaminidase [Bacteroidaceae bacterium]|nr:beta-N-acetylhexosaminidase [Bacteroidaceae bacterium]